MMVYNDVQIIAANIQRVFTRDRARSLLLSLYSRSKADIYLLSEVACTTPDQVATWTAECEDMGFGSIFTVDCQTAILWRHTSRFLPPDTPPTRIRFISRSSSIL